MSKSIVKNMKLSMGLITGSPHKSAFLHAFGAYELVIDQLKSEKFHELPHDAVSQRRKNTMRNQGYMPATAPFAQ